MKSPLVAPNEHVPPRGSERRRQTALLRKLTHDMADATGVAKGAMDELLRESPQVQSRMLVLIERSVGRLERITRRMRLAALIDEDGLTITPTVTALDAIVDQAVLEATTLDPRKTVSIEHDASRLQVDVMVGVDLAVAAVAEHASNAIRFARHRVRVLTRQDQTHGIVEITDDGPGFAPEYVAAVLDREWRKLSPKSALSLGLALELVDRLGGHTEIGAGFGCEGEPAGARVSVFLPRCMHRC